MWGVEEDFLGEVTLHWALGEEERFASGGWGKGRTGIPG